MKWYLAKNKGINFVARPFRWYIDYSIDGKGYNHTSSEAFTKVGTAIRDFDSVVSNLARANPNMQIEFCGWKDLPY